MLSTAFLNRFLTNSNSESIVQLVLLFFSDGRTEVKFSDGRTDEKISNARTENNWKDGQTDQKKITPPQKTG